MIVNTPALIGGLLFVFVLLLFALLVVMWVRGHPLFSYGFCPKYLRRPWKSNWGSSTTNLADATSSNNGFASSQTVNQGISMSNIEVKRIKKTYNNNDDYRNIDLSGYNFPNIDDLVIMLSYIL